jgi:serine/threonine protein phosphatase PrpC
MKTLATGEQPLSRRGGCPRVVDVATAAAQNRRDHMEDFAHVERSFAGRDDYLYAAVFDGHGGDAVSRRASRELHGLLAAELAAGAPVEAAMRRTFLAFDASVAAEPCGSTAAVLVLQGATLAVANAGDSHVLLVSGGSANLLTADHRLTNDAEFRRVVAAGARIWDSYACLSDGGPGLQCTRSLGDREFRRIGILAEPETSSRTLAADDLWLIAATDGVWDGLDPETVGGIARTASTAKEAAERIRDAALDAHSDNVTVVAIRRA